MPSARALHGAQPHDLDAPEPAPPDLLDLEAPPQRLRHLPRHQPPQRPGQQGPPQQIQRHQAEPTAPRETTRPIAAVAAPRIAASSQLCSSLLHFSSRTRTVVPPLPSHNRAHHPTHPVARAAPRAAPSSAGPDQLRALRPPDSPSPTQPPPPPTHPLRSQPPSLRAPPPTPIALSPYSRTP